MTFLTLQVSVRLLLIEMSQLGILDLSPMVKHGELPRDKANLQMGSVRPVQHVAHDRPARLALDGLLLRTHGLKRFDGAIGQQSLRILVEELNDLEVSSSLLRRELVPSASCSDALLSHSQCSSAALRNQIRRQPSIAVS